MFSKFLPFFRKAIAFVEATIVVLTRVVQVMKTAEQQFASQSFSMA